MSADLIAHACFFSGRQRQERVSAQTIQFTQEQARDIAQVSPGDVRAWRKAVPYLAQKPGKAARFTFADLVGLAITSELTGGYGVRISEIGAGVDGLFRLLGDARPAHLEGLVALIERTSAKIFPAGEISERHLTEPAFIVPCDPLLARIGGRMMPLAPGSAQTALPFLPQILRAG
ncbi:hypothetical protein [Brevundimonas sp.]|uniref:hypothetical protein n=1 Tax=Brevundimonas sp. TaxID=1871086 RepID=UPI0028AB840F|nr:hypothetical protein [Brevundimonas sp.]